MMLKSEINNQINTIFFNIDWFFCSILENYSVGYQILLK